MDGRKAWSMAIDRAKNEDELSRIDKDLLELSKKGYAWAGALRFTIPMRRRQLQVNTEKEPTSAPAAPSFAARLGLPAPDGRRLHAYGLSHETFLELQQSLSERRDYAQLDRGYTPALFVLWASEWFRRSYRGGVRRWEDLTTAIQLGPPDQVDQSTLRSITRRGLDQWKRPVFDNGSRHFLATLAREGGFPAHALVGGAHGWAKGVLAAIVGPLMGNPASGEADALQLARSQKGRLQPVFSDDDFVQLCADLAFAIVGIRRECEPLARAAGLPLAAWLTLNRPDWREVLPLSTGDAAADALVETLIEVQAVSGAAAGVERLLLLDPSGVWQEGARISLDGPVAGEAMRDVDANIGRLRAFAAGETGRYFSGELALLDPPGPDEVAWSARSARGVREPRPMPFWVPVHFDLRAGERAVRRIEVPGGKPRRGQFFVAQLDAGSIDAPNVLRVVGSGSGRYRAETLWVRAPVDWTAEAEDGSTVAPLQSGDPCTNLWRVQGGANFFDLEGDCYRVLGGQANAQIMRLELHGDRVRWGDPVDAIDLYDGPPVASRNTRGELLRRAIGSRTWMPVAGTLPLGHYELGWRLDSEMLDRRRIAVLPRGALLRAKRTGNGVNYTVAGFSPATIRPSQAAPVRAIEDGTAWQTRKDAEPVFRFEAVIEWPDAPPLPVVIAYPGEETIARWSGQRLPHRSILALNELRDCVAIADGEMTLLAELKDSTRAQMTWLFSRELPLSAVAADIASLLKPASLDAEVVLDLNNAINTNWHVRHFALELRREGAGFVASSAIVDEGVVLCGRAMTNPAVERCFGAYSLLSNANHRPVVLPADLHGDWLIFLRHGEEVITRPCYVSTESPAEAENRLAHAMAQPPGDCLDQALVTFLRLAEEDNPAGRAALDDLIALTTSLKGLPPVTFRVFTLLPSHPNVLARMALTSAEAERVSIMDLAEALSFAWFLIPQASWDKCRGEMLAGNLAILESTGSKAPAFAKQAVDLTCRTLISFEPLLEPILAPAPECDQIGDIAMRFLQRGAIDRVRGPSWGRYREILSDQLPSRFLDFDMCVRDTLDAPCAAALAVAGKWTPDNATLRHMKLVARTFPTWFAEAFAASLKEQN